MSLITVLIIALVIGYVIGRYQKAHVIQNSGEIALLNAVKSRFHAPNYHLLNHVTIRFNNETTQIDHILVSRYGIFVIETKDYNGWIFADKKSQYWTQVLFRAKFRFQNPLRQNYKHILAVRSLLDFQDKDTIHSVVVFVGDSEFKTDIPDSVFTLSGFLRHIENHNVTVMSENRLQFCIGRIEAHRLAITNETDVEHVQNLRRRHGFEDQ